VAEPRASTDTARQLHLLCAEPIVIGDDRIHISASIGFAQFPDDGHSADELYKNAELALFHSKQQGAGSHARFDRHHAGQMRARQKLEVELRLAVQSGKMTLYFQPKYRVSDRTIVGAEALMRWRRVDGSWVSPVEFIPVAEQSGLIDVLGQIALEQSCALLRRWQLTGVKAVPIAVNLSARQLLRDSLADEVAALLHRYQVSPDLLDLELTESSVMENIESASALLHKLHAIGCKIAVDDFGTGYSSLAYLSQLPLSALKIDRTFVSRIQQSDQNAAIVRAVISLSHSLQLQVIAEGVETEATMDFLRDNHCDLVQGFLFSRALPADDMTALLTG